MMTTLLRWRDADVVVFYGMAILSMRGPKRPRAYRVLRCRQGGTQPQYCSLLTCSRNSYVLQHSRCGQHHASRQLDFTCGVSVIAQTGLKSEVAAVSCVFGPPTIPFELYLSSRLLCCVRVCLAHVRSDGMPRRAALHPHAFVPLRLLESPSRECNVLRGGDTPDTLYHGVSLYHCIARVSQCDVYRLSLYPWISGQPRRYAGGTGWIRLKVLP